jgi:hypothetical protein
MAFNRNVQLHSLNGMPGAVKILQPAAANLRGRGREITMWKNGDRVLARREGSESWLPGIIRFVKGENIYIEFNDGVFELATEVRPPDAAAAAESEPPRFVAGDRILGRWLDLWWYPGTILFEEQGGYQVQFDDGDRGILGENQILPLKLDVGDTVQCRPKEEVRLVYKPGTLTRVAREIIDIEFDDGDSETNSSISRVRLWRSPFPIEHFSFNEGDRIVGRGRDGCWYPADILTIDGDRIVLQYLDGVQGILTPELIRPLEVAVGMRVEGRWRGGDVYYPGKIDQERGERIHIQYDDGDEEWTTVRLIRIPDPSSPPPVPPQRTPGGEISIRYAGQGCITDEDRDPLPTLAGRLDPSLEAARRDLEAGRWRGVRNYLERLPDWEARQFAVEALTRWDGRPGFFDDWVAAEPASPLPWLFRGAHGVGWAWEARGTGAAGKVSDEAWRAFYERLEAADRDLAEAIARDKTDPTPHAFRLVAARGRQAGPAEESRHFQATIQRCRDHRRAHESFLQGHCRKWGGSHEAMFRFASDTLANAPEGSGVVTIVLQAHLEFLLAQLSETGQLDTEAYCTSPEVRDVVRQAYQKSIGSPRYRTSPFTPIDLSTFAFFLTQAGEYPLARAVFDRIGNLVHPAPWDWFGNPILVFRNCRKWARTDGKG